MPDIPNPRIQQEAVARSLRGGGYAGSTRANQRNAAARSLQQGEYSKNTRFSKAGTLRDYQTKNSKASANKGQAYKLALGEYANARKRVS